MTGEEQSGDLDMPCPSEASDVVGGVQSSLPDPAETEEDLASSDDVAWLH